MKSFPTPDPFQLKFPNGHTAVAIQLHRSTTRSKIGPLLTQLGLPMARPTLVVVGGASGISEESFSQLRSLFTEVLAPVIQSLDGVVIDGGTDAGVMKLMGEARQATASTFPLVGVAAIGTVILPQSCTLPSDENAPLEPHHTHFVLVPGGLWGDEAPWIANVATALNVDAPSVTVLVNGGRIAWQDASNSVRVGRPVLVIAGSGRTADELAAAVRGELSSDRATDLIDSGLIHIVDLSSDLLFVRSVVQSMLSHTHQPNAV
ncbi:MAG: hypothetical protein IGR80_04150 [Synechococcales cyanobacterium K44_A2020_017]|nr:hypothetical protein [Synechococcales cyanobacterium K32_A2020_035]MBF2093932.1 hypothetical protein [Synechococcales cyanobacterium K44_A2020_017]